MSENLCPKCSKDDQIGNLPAIYYAGTTTGSFSGPTGAVTYSGGKWGTAGGYSYLSGSSSTGLAKFLKPPSEPTENQLELGLAGIAVFFGLLVLLSTLCALNGNGGYVIVAIMFGVFAFLIGKQGTDREKKHRENYPQAKAEWDRAMAIWKRSYYCFRDNLVFDPETGASCQLENLNTWLYEE